MDDLHLSTFEALRVHEGGGFFLAGALIGGNEVGKVGNGTCSLQDSQASLETG